MVGVNVRVEVEWWVYQNTFKLEQDVFVLNRGYKQETRRRKLKTSKTDFRQAENTGLYMIEKNEK